MEKELMENELRQVRAWMRNLSAELSVMREELAIQERRMERLIRHKEDLEKEMIEVKKIPSGKSGRRYSPTDPLSNIDKLGEEEALKLLALLTKKLEA